MAITWDGVGEKKFETGVDHGVLYIPDEAGDYSNGVAWNGLTNVTESPTGAEQTKTYADNIVYGVLTSVEELEGTITCYTYPDEFDQFNGYVTPTAGVRIGQQTRKPFGFSYRSRVGNDIEGDSFGFKIHLLWGLFASPSEESHDTVNDSPEMTELSYELTGVPVPVTIDGEQGQTNSMTIDSTEVDADALQELLDILYGATGDPMLPTPDEVVAIFAGTPTASNVVVAGDVDSIDITGTTTNVLFTVQAWDGAAFTTVVGGDGVNEAAAEALVLANGIHKVSLSAAAGFHVPAAQANPFYVNVT